ncbi:3-isopropylmalate dehydratase large subunit [Pseudoxanthomonas yeongjuensis]|uniref:3-isopropylmalate dehydratase large subunit n=1 Tax=Pseudoxanthomonas yeongjuensis TaxID=377616 RepID=UPI001B87739C|nr:3-isopropylmalate dehydratase large subunit [Pseudoxanthomonas yeongjuensis]
MQQAKSGEGGVGFDQADGTTLFEKLWAQHVVTDFEDGAALIAIDRILLHERTGAVALRKLHAAQRPVAHPSRTFCTMDHIVETVPGRGDATRVPGGQTLIVETRRRAIDAGIRLFDINTPEQGIVHVISPELGIVLPGVTLVCPDSHTCTQGALGAFAWGIGSTEAEHALATGTLRVHKPKTMRVCFEGNLPDGVTAKDMSLSLISRLGSGGGSGYAVEFAGSTVRALDIEARLTLCNMAAEFAVVTALIAPDMKTFEYLSGRPYAPGGEAWKRALGNWRELVSGNAATFDCEIIIDSGDLAPMVTWGTSPQHAVRVDGQVPRHEAAQGKREAYDRALDYMDLKADTRMADLRIHGAFIGSCTNSRISDLRRAAGLLRGRRVAEGVRAICVPGSTQVRLQAEAEGLDRVFVEAGFQWRESGCSMCFYAGGESFGANERVVSSTNRNFESRQGPRTRTHIASPETVAASALAGHIADARAWAR